MSISPSSSRTSAAAASRAARSVTSTGTTVIRPAATASSSSSRRAEIATRAPRVDQLGGECGADAARRADDPDVPTGEAVLGLHLRLLPGSHGAGGVTIGRPRNHRRMPWSRISAETRWGISRPPEREPSDRRRGRRCRCAGEAGVEHGVTVSTQRDRHPDVVVGECEAHRVVTRHVVERRHVELLVDADAPVRCRASAGTRAVRRRCCAPRRPRTASVPSAPKHQKTVNGSNTWPKTRALASMTIRPPRRGRRRASQEPFDVAS